VNLRKIYWFFLRPFGQFPLLKVSYIALVAIPLASHFPPVFRFGGPYFFPALYFGNLMVALASLLYDIFCPIIIKRFASRNDLYDKMLDIAAKQQQLYPADNWIGTLQHSDEAYKGAAMSGPIKAFLCFLFYLLGFVLLGYVIFERSTAVVRAMLNNL